MIALKKLTNRQKQALETQRKIYESAVKLFSERGYDDVRIVDICEDAGVAVGVFYHYFPSKDEVLGVSYELIYESMEEKIANLGNVDAITKIREVTSLYCRNFMNRGVKYVGIFLSNELFKVSSYFDGKKNNMLSFLRKLVIEAVENEELFGDINAITLDLFKVVRGSSYVGVLKGNLDNLEEETLDFLEIILNNYKTKK